MTNNRGSDSSDPIDEGVSEGSSAAPPNPHAATARLDPLIAELVVNNLDLVAEVLLNQEFVAQVLAQREFVEGVLAARNALTSASESVAFTAPAPRLVSKGLTSVAISYRDDVWPMFRPIDVLCMLRKPSTKDPVKLAHYEWLKQPANYQRVYDAIDAQYMPPDRPWTPNMIATLAAWQAGGFQP
ncbi:MAG: hypothetical protein H0T76_05260 [Nannocystis sp.]|nr:hypothetical protein [Nannocystis sp.]MBA3545872.1 hypothetical protein [Nannocystis sp.]